MKNLYFLRHGETEFNISGSWSGGQTAELLITKEGEKTVKITAQNCSFKPDLIISSTMARARQTAEIFAKEIGYNLNAIRYDKRLIERDFGSLDGKSDILKQTNYFDDESSIDSLEGVESIKDLEARVQEFLSELKNTEESETVIIVGHGVYGRTLKRVIEGRPFKPVKQGLESLPHGKLIKLI